MVKRNTRRRIRTLITGGILCAAIAAGIVIWSPWGERTSGPSSGSPKAKPPSDPANRDTRAAIAALKLPAELPAKPVIRAVSPDLKLLTSEMLKTESLDVCRKAIEDFPASTTPLVLMADLQNKLGDRTEAVKWWRQVLKREPRRIDIYYNLADVADKNGDYEEALRLCRKALTLGPPLPGMYHGMGSCLLELGKPADAVDALQKELRHYPQNPDPYRLLGRAYSQLKQYDKAVENYEKTLSISPRNKAACYGLMIACAKLGQTEKARKYREKFSVLSKEKDKMMRTKRELFEDTERMRRLTAYVHTNAGEIAYVNRRTDQAEGSLKRAGALDPGDLLCRGKLVSLYLAQKPNAEALEICLQLSRIEPNNPLHYQNIGVLFSSLEKFPEAVDALCKAITASPKDPLGYRYLVKVLMQGAGAFAQARTVAEKLVELKPTGPNYYILSQTCEASGDLTAAWKAIERARNLSPANNRIRQSHLRLQTKIKQD